VGVAMIMGVAVGMGMGHEKMLYYNIADVHGPYRRERLREGGEQRGGRSE